MSRIGKLPVAIPEKVEVLVENNTEVAVKGPKGQLKYAFPKVVSINIKDKEVAVELKEDSSFGRSMWGTTRTLINNMVTGVHVGFSKKLEFNGIGYKALLKGSSLQLNLGYSHPIDYKLPEGVTAKVTKNIIELSSCNKELVGFCAAKIRSFRPPEPYKGKGVKYVDEIIKRKAGKTGGKK